MSDKPSSSGQKETFRLLMGYVFADKPLLIKVVLLLLLATSADVAGPLLAKIYIDDYLLPGDFSIQPLMLLLLVYLVTQLGAAWLRYQQTMKFTDMALAAVLDIRKRVFAHVLKLPMRYFDHARTGQLVSRITNDTEAIKDLYVQFLSVVLTNFILLVGIIIAMALLNVQLMLASLLLLPTVVGMIYLYQRLSGPAVASSRQFRSDINANVSESIAGMSVIQAGNQQAFYTGKFNDVNNSYYHARLRTIKIGAALLRPAIDLLSVFVLVGVIWLFGLQVVSGVAEIGVLFAFLNYLGRFTEPLAEITQRFNLYQQAMVAGSRVYELIGEQEEIFEQNSAKVSSGQVQIRQLTFHYHPDKPVIKELDLKVPAGGFYAVVGHTGSGKSTLLSLLLNFYQPISGDIQIDGANLREFGHDELRHGIGVIPQEPFILAASIYDNIDMGRGLTPLQVKNSAKKAHLHHVISEMAEGYHTQLGEGGMRLSTGQRQQLVIARALAASPKILLLDEATANIDSETEMVVQRALNELRGSVTMIVVAHRLSTISHADKILVLSHGEIVEQGKHKELMALENGLYASMYLLQKQAQKVALAEA